MKAKNLISLTGIFAVLLLTLSLASAASLTISNTVIPASVNQNAGSFQITFDLTNAGAEDANVSFTDSVLTKGIGYVSAPVTELLAGQTKKITTTVSFDGGQTGNIEGVIVADPSGAGSNKDFNFSVPIISVVSHFCKNGEQNKTDLTLNVDLSNKGAGEEDDEWLPLDTIQIKVELENDKDIDLDDVVFQVGLFKEGSSSNIADDMIWISKDEDKVEVGDINDRDSKKYTFEFKVDPEVDEGDYLLMVKAYPDKKTGMNENAICIDSSDDFSDSYYQNIKINREDNDERLVIVDTSSIGTLEAACDAQVSFNARIYNIGDEDQEQVKVILENKELGIKIEKEIREDLDIGESRDVIFDFTIPKDAKEKTYYLELRTYYTYDEDDDSYDDYSKISTVPLTVKGNCGVVAVEPTVTARLASNAQVGELMLVQVSVSNPGDSGDFIITADDYNSWAELVSVEPSIVNIPKDGIKQVMVTFNPRESGAKTFTLNIVYNGKTLEQQVQINVAEKTGFLTGAFSGIGNTTLYIIAAVFLVLIVIIIALIIRVASRGKVSEY